MLVDACCAGIELLNLWLPLDDRVVLQPLALMNTSTLDAADQVRANRRCSLTLGWQCPLSTGDLRRARNELSEILALGTLLKF